MTQRSYSNDRYRKDAKLGSTRKSAAKAKPVRKQGTGTSAKPAGKASKSSSGPAKDWSGLPTSPEIKKWQRLWWVLLGGGLVLVGLGSFVPAFRESRTAYTAILMAVTASAGAALYIDLKIIRKLRNELIAGAKKSSKHDAKGAS